MQTQAHTIRGSLNPDALARAMRGLSLSRSEGVLHLSSDGSSKRVYFRDGWIIFAGSDNEQERLGEVLVRAGKLKRAELELALRVIQETGRTFGETVVEMGFLTRDDLEAHALERTRGILRSVFSWTSGQLYFDERDASVAESIALQIPAAAAILEGVRSAGDGEFVRRRLGDSKAVLRRTETPLGPLEQGTLSVSMEWVLHQANGVSTLEQIVAKSSWQEDETRSSIYSLVAAGLLEIESPESEMAAREQDIHSNAESVTSRQRDALPETVPETEEVVGPSTGSPQTIGRYEVTRLLGRGSMGAVYMASDPTLERTVAIKLIQTAAYLKPAELERYRERFYREAKAAGRLLHPGIVAVFDMGHTEDETPFIVLEYVHGRTLTEVQGRHPLDEQETVRLAVDVLEALAYAHSKGIVHRDVKPANILVTAEGRGKIMDFGIAYVVGSELTNPGEMLGSPSYMAPEQLSKGTIDQRTDLFAFGVVLYRLLTGTLPFTGNSFAAVAEAILSEEPVAPDTLNPAVPAGLSSLVLRCLAKEPSRRFGTAQEVKTALVSVLQQEGALLESDDLFSTEATFSGPMHTGVAASPEGGEDSEPTIPIRWRLPRAPKRFQALVLLAGSLALGLALLIPSAMERPSAGGSTERREGAPNLGVAPDELAGQEVKQHGVDEAGVAAEGQNLEQIDGALEKPDGTDPRAPELASNVSETLAEPQLPNAPGNVDPQEPRPRFLTDAELFYQAQLALEAGELDESRAGLEELSRRNPSFAGGSELLVKVTDEIWKDNLPLSITAKHNHRMGSCRGTLTLGATGIAYTSDDHGWEWEFNQIRFTARDGRALRLETFEKDLVGLGKPKNYKFLLSDTIPDDDWTRYERLARQP